ncbi:hypothetical protein NIES23_06490 [Trichormus variabilis NIES-23]|uniref:Uncharacterized protein n=1 Tax=Trichormus variabilis NIES-23 TaxID=1973479 RepID=A0A1Z4KFZ8_ANAVA|nr:hypothetical protein NIES23_06490 [Trichormus variabilis NIES-23]
MFQKSSKTPVIPFPEKNAPDAYQRSDCLKYLVNWYNSA